MHKIIKYFFFRENTGSLNRLDKVKSSQEDVVTHAEHSACKCNLKGLLINFAKFDLML